MQQFRIDTPTDADRVRGQRALLERGFDNLGTEPLTPTGIDPHHPPQTVLVRPHEEDFCPYALDPDILPGASFLTGVAFEKRLDEISKIARESARKTGGQLTRHEPMQGVLERITEEEREHFRSEATFDVLPRDWFFYRREWEAEAKARDRMEYVD